MIEGKTCLITGSTSGIGKEIAIGLAKMKANVILVGRNKAKCQATTEEIWGNASISTNKNRVSYLLADLSSQACIRQLANEFLDSYEVLIFLSIMLVYFFLGALLLLIILNTRLL